MLVVFCANFWTACGMGCVVGLSQSSACETWAYKGVLSVGVFLRDPLARIYMSFRENQGKLRTARSTSATEV